MSTTFNNPTIQVRGDHINNVYIRYLNCFDRLITNNLREGGIETRLAGNNGLWCCAILPAVLIIYNTMYNVSSVYSILAYTSIGLLCYSILFISFLSVSCLVLKEQVYGGCIASSLISALPVYIFLEQDLIASLLCTIPAVFSYSTLLKLFLTNFPKTFTIGEAMIVVQSIVLYGVMTAASLYIGGVHAEMDFITAIVNTVLFTVGAIVTKLSWMTTEQRSLPYLRNVFAGAACFGLIMLHCFLGMDCILKIYIYVFFNLKRMTLVIFWLILVMASVCLLLIRTQLAVKANTVTRKSFHILASSVFLSGIILDQNLTTLAAGLGFGLLVLVEALRKCDIKSVSSALQSAFLIYSDEKDSGLFAMTPFYLYCGLAGPLLLVPEHPGCKLEMLSGVLSIGVGDSAASWFGSSFGCNKWIGTSKTIEGTAFNILCQVSTVYALQMFDLIDTRQALLRTVFAATISGIVEAFTVQVDNLILPIVTLLAFQMTYLPLRLF